MEGIKKLPAFLIGLGVVVMQLTMTQVVTFIATLPFPDMEDFPQTHSGLFVVILGLTFSAGVFLVGWLALKLSWLKSDPKLPARMASTLIGAYLPLIVALVLYRTLAPGNPFYLISILASIVGFHAAGWRREK